MQLERPPKPESVEPARGSWFLFALTIFVILMVWAIGLMIFPTFFILIGVLFGLIGIQYVLWGYWFEKYLRQQPTDEQDFARPDREHDSRPR